MGIIESKENTAATERLWSHTIGISGTGVAAIWGKRHFILTAKHVLDLAQVSDLCFFVRQTGELRSQYASEVTMQDAVVPVPLTSQDVTICRCDWEDLALLTVTPNGLGPMLEFFDIANSWLDPAEGEFVAGVGYPVSNSVILEEGRVGSVIQKAVLLSPTPFNGTVLPPPSEDELKFKMTSFVPERHFLIPYEPAKEGKRPGGISGAAVWCESRDGYLVWAPRFKFAGVCTSCYKSGTIEQVVKASVVRQFLTEAFGAP